MNDAFVSMSWLSLGPAGWLLVALLGAAVVIFAERAIYLHRGQIRAGAFMAGIRNLVVKNRISEAITVCDETPGPVARVVKAGLMAVGRSEPLILAQMQAAALLELPLLERRVGSLAMIARLGPLCGLIGAILALLGGYFKMAAQGPYAYATLFASEVTQGCLSTVLGLIVALVAYSGYHVLRGRVRSITYDVEWAGAKVLPLLVLGEDLDQPQQERTPQ